MDNLERQVENSLDMFLLAAKECGFETSTQIKENFEIIRLLAGAMVAAQYELIVLNQE